MDVSELRKRILRSLEEARLEAASKRADLDHAAKAYEDFVNKVAAPLLRQAQTVLKAEGHFFTVHSPAGAAQLVSDRSTETFLDFILDRRGSGAQIIGRVSVNRGRQGVTIDEHPIAPEKSVAEVNDEDVAAFLVSAIPTLIVKS